MRVKCLYCGNENPKHGMKTCSRKCADELKKINSREKRFCLYCKNEFEVRKKEEKKLCSEDCRKKWSNLPENIKYRINSYKKAIKEKYGVNNIFQLECVKEKLKQTKLDKYGDENYNNFEKMLITKKEKYGDDYLKNWYKNTEKTLQENYGVSHGLQIEKFKDKKTKTTFKKYGVKNVSQLQEFKEKRTETMKERFGVENISQNESVKKQKKATSFKNFGVEHHLKDSEMFIKHFKAQHKIKPYKDSGINYQGSYEKYFLELIEEKDLLSEVSSGDSFIYTFNGVEHTYYVDFKFRGKQIEIKSGWTYNKNGKDLELQNINEAKWKSVRDLGENLIVLIDKSEIKGFIKGLC